MRVKMTYQDFVARMQAAGATKYESTPNAETWVRDQTMTVAGYYYHATEEAEPLDWSRTELEDRYGLWLAENGLPDQCAEELVHEDLTEAQRRWLGTFILNWDRMEQLERR